MDCRNCGIELTGRRTAFCSDLCRSTDSNRIHQSYEAQQARGLARKQEFIDSRGGGCEKCGYKQCLAALEFHHRDRETKQFTLDLRSLSNRTLAKCQAELEKCVLLCANCHREEEEELRIALCSSVR